MRARKYLSGVATAALAVSALAVAAPAHAAGPYTYEPDDPAFYASGTHALPASSDLIGIGSDTSQHAVHLAGEVWNAQPGVAFRVASFSATVAGKTPTTAQSFLPLPGGDLDRAKTSGSGNGKSFLFTTGSKNANNPDIDFARSSGSLNSTEKAAGLQQIPFALDVLRIAVSGNVPSHAPATLTSADIVNIYKCTTTDWGSVSGGTSGPIKVLIPKPGSGTRDFFYAQLTALNGGVPLTSSSSTDASCWNDVEEHDPTPIMNDATAIAPFSQGRAQIATAAGDKLRLEDGFSAQRALYDVVRGTNDPAGAGVGLGNADLAAVFGSDGFLCSNAARDAIAAAGFQQLARPGQGGVCGVATQDPTTNFTLNQQVTTATTLTGSSTAGGAADLVATVTAATAPSGSVEFFEGATSLGVSPLTQGRATLSLVGQSVGDHTYTAKFTGDTPSQDPSQADVTVHVKSGSATSVTVAPAAAYGATRTITATVAAGSAPATGTVTIGYGTVSRTVALTDGHATLAVPATTKAGGYTARVGYAGTDSVAPSSGQVAFTIAKAKARVTESFPTTVKHGRTLAGAVTVSIAGSTLKPTGVVKLMRGTKVLAKGRLVAGRAVFKGVKLALGKNKLVASYGGDANVGKAKLAFLVTQK